MSTWTFGCCNYRVNKLLGCFRMYRFIADLRCKQLEKGRHHFRVFSFIEKEKDFNWWKEAANRSFLSSNKGTYQVAYSKTECGCYFRSSSHTFRPFKKAAFISAWNRIPWHAAVLAAGQPIKKGATSPLDKSRPVRSGVSFLSSLIKQGNRWLARRVVLLLRGQSVLLFLMPLPFLL